MSEPDLIYWAKFSHEWSLPALMVVAVFIGIVIAVNVFNKHLARNSGSLAAVNSRRVTVVANVMLGPAIAFLLFTQLHFPCAGIAAARTHSMQNMKAVASAQLMYSNDNDDFVCTAADWPDKVKDPSGSSCRRLPYPNSDGSFGYGMNKIYASKSLGAVDYPTKTVLVFESKGATVGTERDLDSSRHAGRPVVAVADGSARVYRPDKSDAFIWTVR